MKIIDWTFEFMFCKFNKLLIFQFDPLSLSLSLSLSLMYWFSVLIFFLFQYDYKITVDTCGNDESNGYISGSQQVSVSNFIYKGKFTAIQSYEYDKSVVFLLGTSNGHLLKLVSLQTLFTHVNNFLQPISN